MLVGKKTKFCKLFKEFINSYPYTPAGLRHTAAYNEQRQHSKRNFEAISSAFESGEEVTEAVLLQLLPYNKSANNVQIRAWIHQTPAITDITKQIESIWRLEIEPYLEEYFFDQPSKVNQFRWDKVKPQVCP